MGALICPVCGENLVISGKSYLCPNRHCFDCARSGYVNLLQSTGGGVHGDNKLMVQARRAFLDKGFYSPLAEELCRTVGSFAKNGDTLLDAGCGEGYYTSLVRANFDRSDIAVNMIGIDISKTAVDYAAKREKNVTFAAASIFSMPVGDSSCDILMTLFAPYCGEEFLRVLKPGGIMVMVIPSENHLWELKSAIYDRPYKNEVKPYELDGFTFLGSKRISFDMELTCAEDIRSLFSMTPYYYKTGKTEQSRLESLERLATQADFEVLSYRKN